MFQYYNWRFFGSEILSTRCVGGVEKLDTIVISNLLKMRRTEEFIPKVIFKVVTDIDEIWEISVLSFVYQILADIDFVRDWFYFFFVPCNDIICLIS